MLVIHSFICLLSNVLILPKSTVNTRNFRIMSKKPITEYPSRFNLSLGFLGGSDGKESACNAGDPSSIPGSGRSPGEGNGNSTILAWRIPWTEESGGLQSMGLQNRTRLSD